MFFLASTSFHTLHPIIDQIISHSCPSCSIMFHHFPDFFIISPHYSHVSLHVSLHVPMVFPTLKTNVLGPTDGVPFSSGQVRKPKPRATLKLFTVPLKTYRILKAVDQSVDVMGPSWVMWWGNGRIVTFMGFPCRKMCILFINKGLAQEVGGTRAW